MMGRAMPWLVARFLRASSVSATVRRMPISYRVPAIVAPRTHGRLITTLHAPTHLSEHHHRIRPGVVSRLKYFWNSPTVDTKRGE